MRTPTARPNGLWAWCLLLVLGSGPSATAAVEAQPGEPPGIVGIRVGFDGHYRVGLWTPVEVTLRAGSLPIAGQLSLTVPDGDGVLSRVATRPDRPCKLSPGRDTPVLVYARFGRIESRLSVEFRVDGGPVRQRVFMAAEDPDGKGEFPLATAATRGMIVGVGADSLGVEEAIGLLRQPPEEQTVAVRLEDVGQLPGQWIGYEGVDTLVLSTSRPEIYRGLTPGGPQVEALDRWVRMGGKLIVCAGARAGEFHGGERLLAPLAVFLPGRLEMQEVNGNEEVKILRLLETRALETYCASATLVPSDDADDEVQAPKLIDLDPDGIVEAQEADLPLVVRTPRGFGQIVFFAGDLDRPPLSRWNDRPQLVSRLLGLPTEQPEGSAGSATMMHYGFEDMSGQLRRALDQFTEVRVVPFSVVVVLIVIYVALIGPGDYFFLRRLTRRMEWTWVTFPLIVLAFCIGAYVLAHRLKGDQVRINQIDLVDVDVASGRGPDRQGTSDVRGTSWMNIFSPRTEAFNLSLRPAPADPTVPQDARVFFSWLGLPGRALGGMAPRASSPVVWTGEYDFSPELGAVENLPIRVWSTKSLTARWTGQTNVYPTAELAETGRIPAGTITNTLGVPLSNCFLAYGRRAYILRTSDNLDDPDRLGTLQPGETTVIDARTREMELRTLLLRKQVKLKEGYRWMAAPYDQSSVELPYILRVMMFFQAAEGRGYTGLGNGYQGFVDLSHLLKTNRAILVAQGPPGHHGAELLCKHANNQPMIAREDQHVTIYRFVLPVKTGASE